MGVQNLPGNLFLARNVHQFHPLAAPSFFLHFAKGRNPKIIVFNEKNHPVALFNQG